MANVQKWTFYIETLSNAFKTLGRDVFYAVMQSYMFFRFLSPFVDALYKYEKRIIEIGSLLREGQTSVWQYTEAFEQMSVQTGAALDDILQGIYDLISAGYSMDESINMMRALAVTAQATVTPIKTLTSAMITLMQAFKIPAEEAGDVLAKLFATIQYGRGTMEDLAKSIGTVAEEAALLGVSLDELLAAYATMTRVLPNAAKVTTALRNMFRALGGDISDTARAALQTADYFGVLSLSLDPVYVSAVGLENVFRELSKLDLTGLQRIFPGVRQATAIKILVANWEEFGRILRKIRAIKFEDVYLKWQEAQNTFYINLSKIRAAFSAFRLQIARQIAPAVEGLLKTFMFFISIIIKFSTILHGLPAKVAVLSIALSAMIGIISILGSGITRISAQLNQMKMQMLSAATAAGTLGAAMTGAKATMVGFAAGALKFLGWIGVAITAATFLISVIGALTEAPQQAREFDEALETISENEERLKNLNQQIETLVMSMSKAASVGDVLAEKLSGTFYDLGENVFKAMDNLFTSVSKTSQRFMQVYLDSLDEIVERSKELSQWEKLLIANTILRIKSEIKLASAINGINYMMETYLDLIEKESELDEERKRLRYEIEKADAKFIRSSIARRVELLGIESKWSDMQRERIKLSKEQITILQNLGIQVQRYISLRGIPQLFQNISQNIDEIIDRSEVLNRRIHEVIVGMSKDLMQLRKSVQDNEFARFLALTTSSMLTMGMSIDDLILMIQNLSDEAARADLIESMRLKYANTMVEKFIGNFEELGRSLVENPQKASQIIGEILTQLQNGKDAIVKIRAELIENEAKLKAIEELHSIILEHVKKTYETMKENERLELIKNIKSIIVDVRNVRKEVYSLGNQLFGIPDLSKLMNLSDSIESILQTYDALHALYLQMKVIQEITPEAFSAEQFRIVEDAISDINNLMQLSGNNIRELQERYKNLAQEVMTGKKSEQEAEYELWRRRGRYWTEQYKSWWVLMDTAIYAIMNIDKAFGDAIYNWITGVGSVKEAFKGDFYQLLGLRYLCRKEEL
ncbi:MAG: phage tail tape measure protein [Candidatus Helarchaeota archaeon]